ncbi:unnamed protein product [Ascophyllum nodosum]
MVVSAIPILATSSCSSGRVARRTGWTDSAVRGKPATRRITTNPFAIFLPASEPPRVWPILFCFSSTTGATIVWQASTGVWTLSCKGGTRSGCWTICRSLRTGGSRSPSIRGRIQPKITLIPGN